MITKSTFCQTFSLYGVDQFFPLTLVMLFLYQHCAVINITTEVFVETLVVSWNFTGVIVKIYMTLKLYSQKRSNHFFFTFWWEWSEQICILFQYVSERWLNLKKKTSFKKENLFFLRVVSG